jgi:uncharacterized protein (TIGR02145 family)
LTLGSYKGTIQWQHSTTSATAGFTNVAGATSDILHIGSLTKTTWYRAVVKSGVCEQATSDPVMITVIPASAAGNITADKSSVCYNTGTTVKLENYEGDIQWQRSTTSATENFVNIPGTTNILPTGNLTQTTWYRAVVTSGLCPGGTSAAVEIKITPGVTLTLTSVSGTDNQTLRVNTAIENITYSYTGATNVTISGLPTGVTGSWSDGVITISGVPTETGIFNYTVEVTNDCGTALVAGIIHVLPACPEEVYDAVNDTWYNVVDLALHCWFKENLSATKYQNDTDIPFAKPYYNAFYSDTTLYKTTFGLLYNYESVFPVDPNQKLCPDGWRIPTSEEWALLNMYNVEDLKNPDYWLQPNHNTDILEFHSFGAGFYNGDAQRFESLYGYTAYWSSDTPLYGTNTGIGAVLRYNCSQIEILEIKKTNAISVRCILGE